METINKYGIYGSLYGFLIGDALGVPVEFSSRKKLKSKPVEGMLGYGTYDVPEGTWSDDTSMTLATMDSISKIGDIDYYDIMNNFCKWYKYADYTGTGVFFDIGNTTRYALNKFLMGVNPLKCGGTDGKSNGNGSLMRILPIVLFLKYNNYIEDDRIKIINESSSLTHAHEISKLGCKIYSDYISQLLDGIDKIKALDNLSKINYKLYYSSESIKYYNRILSGNIKNVEEDNIDSSGFIVSSLETSIWCFLKSKNYEESVLKAVNLGSDTDTIAAITGSLSGAYYGFDSINKNWLSTIKNLELFNNIFKLFYVKTFTSKKRHK